MSPYQLNAYEKARVSRAFLKVSDGIRTHDRLDHNQTDGVMLG